MIEADKQRQKDIYVVTKRQLGGSSRSCELANCVDNESKCLGWSWVSQWTGPQVDVVPLGSWNAVVALSLHYHWCYFTAQSQLPLTATLCRYQSSKCDYFIQTRVLHTYSDVWLLHCNSSAINSTATVNSLSYNATNSGFATVNYLMTMIQVLYTLNN